MPDVSVLIKNKIAIGDGTKIICGNSDYIVGFSFDAEWDEYEAKTMRVKYGNRSYTDVVFTGDRCALPIIADKACIEIGVFAGNLHTTSGAYFDCIGSIRCGAGAPADPEPSVYDQIMEKLNGSGSVDPEAIAKAVADYLAEHPLEEKDPTVPDWAKAEEKPTYTAKEVGAIADTELQTAIDSALAQAKASGEFDGAQGKDGSPGAKGDKGDTGAAGHTPEKGVDYWTAADKSGIVDDVLAALPTWTGGNY